MRLTRAPFRTKVARLARAGAEGAVLLRQVSHIAWVARQRLRAPGGAVVSNRTRKAILLTHEAGVIAPRARVAACRRTGHRSAVGSGRTILRDDGALATERTGRAAAAAVLCVLRGLVVLVAVVALLADNWEVPILPDAQQLLASNVTLDDGNVSNMLLVTQTGNMKFLM